MTGLDLSKPLGDGDFGQVQEAFHRYAVLVFPEQRRGQVSHYDIERR